MNAGNLTANATTRLRGLTRFGSLGEDVNMDGFRVDVMQSAVQHMREIVTPGGTRNVVTREPVFGPSYNHWIEQIGHNEDQLVMTSAEQAAYSVDTEVIDVEAIPGYYGDPHPTSNIVTPGSPAYDVFVPTGQYDENGQEILETIHYNELPPVYEMVQDYIPAVPAVTHIVHTDFPYQPAVYEMRSVWVVDSIIEHDDYLGELQIGETEVISTVTDPDTITTESYTDYSAPMARFTGTRPGLTWVWRNWQDAEGTAMRDLMTLSEGGLLLPNPADGSGNYNASLSYNKFEQSWSGPQQSQSGVLFRSFGSSMERDKIAVWNASGAYQADSNSQISPDKDSVEIASDGVTVKSDSQGNGSTVQSQATHIKSTFATFAGNVAVKGVIRVQPAGDIDMGTFIHGPQP